MSRCRRRSSSLSSRRAYHRSFAVLTAAPSSISRWKELGGHRQNNINTVSHRLLSSDNVAPYEDGPSPSVQRLSNSTHLDFFGEPVTFLNSTTGDNQHTAMAALDNFQLAVVSKGKTATGGGDELGLEIQGQHASAIAWAEALRFAVYWNQSESDKSCPMLAVVTVAPVLAHGGLAYVDQLDRLLAYTKAPLPGLDPVQLLVIAENALQYLDSDDLDQREQMSLRILHHLMEQDPRRALNAALRLLRMCPGDILALSLVMDLAQILGDRRAAINAAGSVSAYWNERSGGILKPAIPGNAMATAIMAVGFGVDGHFEEAEKMSEVAMKQAKKSSGGLATWAQCYTYDAAGRVAEGISALGNTDGIANYEGCGFLFFERRLGGYGARFSLDREERGRGKSQALRLYDINFDSELERSYFATGHVRDEPFQRAPISWTDRMFTKGTKQDAKKPSVLGRFFGSSESSEKEESTELEQGDSSLSRDKWDPSIEDVMTFPPPSIPFLTDATMLLLRFTLNGTISVSNARWQSLRNAWSATLDLQRRHGPFTVADVNPLGGVAASLLFPPADTGGADVAGGRLAEALSEMGSELKLTELDDGQTTAKGVRELIAEAAPTFWLPDEDAAARWKAIVDKFVDALDGVTDRAGQHRFENWEFEARPILEHAVVYAACKAGDTESLSVARAICSKGVTLRTSSPEEWWRYSIVLGLLGDQVASEDALSQSINVGGGQGAR